MQKAVIKREQKKTSKRKIMELKETEGKDIALVVDNIEKEGDVCVYLGRIIKERDEYFFINQAQSWRVSLNADHIQKVRPVPDQMKSILLNADYFFTMTIATLPDVAHERFRNTNLKWPE
jgi:hypothetical protein